MYLYDDISQTCTTNCLNVNGNSFVRYAGHYPQGYDEVLRTYMFGLLASGSEAAFLCEQFCETNLLFNCRSYYVKRTVSILFTTYTCYTLDVTVSVIDPAEYVADDDYTFYQRQCY